MRKLFFLLLSIYFSSCDCVYYKYFRKQEAIPVTLFGGNRPLSVCGSGEQISLTFPEEKREYDVGTDSTAHGYVGLVHYIDRQPSSYIVVGEGSEFKVGKCLLRVVKVYYPYYKDTTGSGVIWYSKLALQYLSVPENCCKTNHYLKKYEKKGLPTDWEKKRFNN